MTRSIRLGVTSVNEFNCERRTILQILLAEQDIHPPFSPNKYVYAGNFLHLILQRIFLKNFSNVEYFYYRKEKSVYEALLLSMKILKIKSLQKSRRFQHCRRLRFIYWILCLINMPISSGLVKLLKPTRHYL